MKRFLLLFLTMLLSPWIWAQKPTVQIRLTGFHIHYWPVNKAYQDPGYFAFDSVDNSYYTRFVNTTGALDTTKLGVYQLTYSIADSIAICTPVTRTVYIADGSPPVIELLGRNVITSFDSIFEEPGYKLTDNYYPDSVLRGLLTIAHSANMKVTGNSYMLLDEGPGWISYHLTDPTGNIADSAVRLFSRVIHPGMPELANTSFTIYPNPAGDVLNIKSDLVIDHSFLMDALGNTYTLTAEKSSSDMQINLSEFDEGLYTLIIESDQQRYFTKLLLTHPR